jgi:predicted nucleic acid-binding protein
VTVLDTSGVIDFLLGGQAAKQVEGLLDREGSVAAPELLVFEVLAVLRRDALRHNLTVADALFVALAERLEEPLATKDRGLAAAARSRAGVEVIDLEAAG